MRCHSLYQLEASLIIVVLVFTLLFVKHVIDTIKRKIAKYKLKKLKK